MSSSQIIVTVLFGITLILIIAILSFTISTPEVGNTKNLELVPLKPNEYPFGVWTLYHNSQPYVELVNENFIANIPDMPGYWELLIIRNQEKTSKLELAIPYPRTVKMTLTGSFKIILVNSHLKESLISDNENEVPLGIIVDDISILSKKKRPETKISNKTGLLKNAFSISENPVKTVLEVSRAVSNNGDAKVDTYKEIEQAVKQMDTKIYGAGIEFIDAGVSGRGPATAGFVTRESVTLELTKDEIVKVVFLNKAMSFLANAPHLDISGFIKPENIKKTRNNNDERSEKEKTVDVDTGIWINDYNIPSIPDQLVNFATLRWHPNSPSANKYTIHQYTYGVRQDSEQMPIYIYKYISPGSSKEIE